MVWSREESRGKRCIEGGGKDISRRKATGGKTNEYVKLCEGRYESGALTEIIGESPVAYQQPRLTLVKCKYTSSDIFEL